MAIQIKHEMIMMINLVIILTSILNFRVWLLSVISSSFWTAHGNQQQRILEEQTKNSNFSHTNVKPKW